MRARWAAGAALVVALGLVLGYVAASMRLYRAGFPLDDAWIHQTYARELRVRGHWAYRPDGQGRGGVTAPLWVMALALSQAVLRAPGPAAWVWGTLALAALATLAWAWPGLTPRARWVAWAAVLGEWHLVWAAASGMETAAFAAVAFASLAALARPQPRWRLAGLAAGVAVWLRPEGVLLALPAAWRAMGELGPWRMRAHKVARFVVPLTLAVLAYVAFHRALLGVWWPTTGQAKIAEYAILRQRPLLSRWARVVFPILVGPGWIWLLFALGNGFVSLRRGSRARWFRDPSSLLLLWALTHTGAYAWALPVTYQHGRYVMPVLPAVVLAGVLAWQRWARAAQQGRARRLQFAGIALALGLTVGFLPLGARAFAWDVAFIESEMVDTARWVAQHVPPDAVVAAHDIGALGYYAPQPLADLAGLLSPEVIPFIRDEEALARWLVTQQARYLVTFPGWYERLDACSTPLFVTRAPFAPKLGGENMVVYRWQPCPTPAAR
ncbi:MAG: hypothetical protein GXO54_07395 [Chloroflexi bacterium]|nr:hypothetical protein [Chloroflexota bacterium]